MEAVSSDILLFKDTDLEENEHFISSLFLPYFKDIFLDLSEKSDAKNKYINKLIF